MKEKSEKMGKSNRKLIMKYCKKIIDQRALWKKNV